MSTLLRKGSFLGTKSGNLILVYNSEWVGEFEEEHIAIIARMKPESEKVILQIINYDDKEFLRAEENGSIFRCNKFGRLRKYYKIMKSVLKRDPNYSSVLIESGHEFD